MPTYVYEALNAAGKPEKGRIEADSSDAAITAIRQNGFYPTNVREERIKGSPSKEDKKEEKKKNRHGRKRRQRGQDAAAKERRRDNRRGARKTTTVY